MFIKLNSKRHDGFLLYESVISLMVTIMTLGILQQSLQLMKIIQNTSYRDQLRWHITNEKLQDTIEHVNLRRVSDDKIIFNKKNQESVYVIESYGPIKNKLLRITTATAGGHEPIITNLNKIRIEKNRNLVIITTVNKADEKSVMYLTNDE